jgi:hypothetical protein
LADNKVVWIALGVVALVAVIVILVALSSGGDENGGADTETGSGSAAADSGDESAAADASGYTEAVESAFVQSCTAGSGEPACQCAWDTIVEQIPFDEFAAMDQALRDDPELQSDPEALAAAYPELVTIMTDCVASTTS